MAKSAQSRITHLAAYNEKKLGAVRRAGVCLNGIEDLIATLEKNSDLAGIAELIQNLWATHDQLLQTFGVHEDEI